jgi:hypothetical protein
MLGIIRLRLTEEFDNPSRQLWGVENPSMRVYGAGEMVMVRNAASSKIFCAITEACAQQRASTALTNLIGNGRLYRATYCRVRIDSPR